MVFIFSFKRRIINIKIELDRTLFKISKGVHPILEVILNFLGKEINWANKRNLDTELN